MALHPLLMIDVRFPMAHHRPPMIDIWFPMIDHRELMLEHQEPMIAHREPMRGHWRRSRAFSGVPIVLSLPLSREFASPSNPSPIPRFADAP